VETLGPSISFPGKSGSPKDISLGAVLRVARICALGLGLEELLGELCREIRLLAGADWCSIVSCPDDDPSRREVWSHTTEQELPDPKEVFGRGPLWDALVDRLREEGTLVSGDIVRLSPDDLFRRIYAACPVRSALLAPLKFGTRIVGLLAVHAIVRPRSWSEAETRVLGDIVAPIVAAALERRNMEERRRASEARYRFLAENAPDFISLHDPDGRYLYASPVATRMLGYRPEEMVGSPITSFLRDQDQDKVLAENRRIVAREIGSGTLLHRIRRKDGTLAEIEAIASAVLDDRGHVRQVLRIARDLTGRRQAESHLTESQKAEAIGMLAGGVAHEFNNLLVGITGAAEMLSLLLAGNAEAEKYLAMIERNGSRAVELTRQLLAYARRGRHRPEVLSLNRTVADEIPFLKAAFPASVELRLELADDLPPVLADPSRIRQVVMSLCLNAGESMSGGGIVTIRTGTEDGPASGSEDSVRKTGQRIERRLRSGFTAPGPLAVLEVSDTGCGMDEETIARVFEPFFSTKSVGRGMGLAAVRGIVDNHGGEIRIVSEAGKGTAFAILFPAVREGPAREDAARPPSRDRKGLILVADDEDDVRAMVRAMVESFGYDVIEARNGFEAVELFRDRHLEIDLVLLDLMMPRMTGEEAFAEIRRINPRVPGILASGYDESGRVGEIDAEGFVSFLQKPFRRGELGRKVDEALEDRSRGR
jgi:two-component system, cell cycle sensor histidine kinase and response regulator CckA